MHDARVGIGIDPISENRFGCRFGLCMCLGDAMSKNVLFVCCGSYGSDVVDTVAEWIAVKFWLGANLKGDQIRLNCCESDDTGCGVDAELCGIY